MSVPFSMKMLVCRHLKLFSTIQQRSQSIFTSGSSPPGNGQGRSEPFKKFKSFNPPDRVRGRVKSFRAGVGERIQALGKIKVWAGQFGEFFKCAGRRCYLP